MLPVKHLYLHVPFCGSKCAYCAFYTVPGETPEKMSRYVDAALTELIRWSPQLAPETIFIGGGTPSILPLPLWQQLLTGLKRHLPLEDVTEWTVECNPATVEDTKARLWRDAGVNRISMGVQSFDDAMLRTLGRIHTAAEAQESLAVFRAAGFDNINLDLMFGLPGQTMAQWCDTLRHAIALQPEHISAYCLTLEEDTAFWRRFLAGKLRPDEELNVAMFEETISILTGAGYRQYEISNFAQPGRACRHNLAYWRVEDYLGLGPSAVSTVGQRRWENVADTGHYIAGHAPPASEETITPELRQAERAAFGLRMNDGVPGDLVRGRWDSEIATLLADGLVQWREDRLQLTRRGRLFADEVAAAFV